MKRAILVLLACLVVTVLTASFALSEEDRSKQGPPSTRDTRFQSTALNADPMVSSLTEIGQLKVYLDAVKAEEDHRHLVEYISAIQAAEAEQARLEQERLEQERQAQLARSKPVYNAPAPMGTAVGECTGFAIPDYIIQRESGGDPNAHNPSGAHGCSQTLLSHYSGGGSCAGLDPYTVEGQRQCTWILSDGGRNLDPWAETR